MITIADSTDLNLAKQLSRLLKITVFIHGREPLPILDASEVQAVRNELAIIRDKVNTLLDALDLRPKESESHTSTSSHSQPSQPVGVVTTTKLEGRQQLC